MRTLAFLFGCMPVRFGIPIAIKKDMYSEFIGTCLFLIGFSFIFLFLTRSRMTAFEGGGITYWHNFRPIHGCLYLLGGWFLLAQCNPDISSKLMLCDALLGLAIFVNEKYNN